MTASYSHDVRNFILGGLIGASISILLVLSYGPPKWERLNNPGLSDPEDKVTEIIGYNALKKMLYLKRQSGIAIGCPDPTAFLELPMTCQRLDHELILQDLHDSFQCGHRSEFPTLMPPGVPLAETESYPCYMGRFQINHIVLADGSVWHLSQSIPEDNEYWEAILTFFVGVFGFGIGMFFAAIAMVIRRAPRSRSK